VGLILQPEQPISQNAFAASPITAVFDAYPRIWVKDASGDVVWGSTMSGIKPSLGILNKWYKDGLIDRQFPTRTWATNAGLIQDGQAGVFFAPWWIYYSLWPEFYRNNPEGVLQAYNSPLDPNGRFKAVWPPSSSAVLLVNKGYAHPEALIKMLSVGYDALRGINMEWYERIFPILDSGAGMSEAFPTGNINLDFEEIVPAVGYLTKNYIENGKLEGLPGMYHSEFDLGLAKMAKEWIEGDRDPEAQGWIHYYARYYASNMVAAPEVDSIRQAYAFSTPSMPNYRPNLEKLENEAMLRIILGEEPLDAFDKFVSDWYGQGGQILTDEVREIIK